MGVFIGHLVTAFCQLKSFFSSLKWVKEKIESKVFESVIVCGDFNYSGISWREYVGTSVDLNELNFIE